MTSTVNITRDEARERSTLVTAHSYHVIVDVTGRGVDENLMDNPEVNFVSTTTARFSSAAGRTWIDMIADSMVDGWLDGQRLDPSAHDGTRLYLDLDEGEHQLTVTGVARYSRTGEGLHRFVDPADGKVYLYTQFETADARRMYACFDQPDQKATFEVSVIAPEHWKVYSNSPTPAPEPSGEGFATWNFAPTAPIATYITALVAGEFHVEHRTITSVKGELGADFVCRESMAPFLETDQMLTTTQRGFDIYEKAFHREYPFDKYDQLFLPEYNAGAMENAGCVTFRDEYLFRSRVTANEYSQRDNTILHELAHMWFGDLVTMRWWDDLWLNESFAEWASTWCQSEITKTHGGIDSWTTFANLRKLWAYTTDQLPTTHPVAADMIDLETVDQNFDGITYAKGASVLKQLVAYVGEEAFFTGVSNYFNEHAWGNTEFSDLLGALEQASGRDLSDFAGQWLETSGANIVRPQFEVRDGHYAGFGIHQAAVGQQILRTHRMGIGLYDLQDSRLVRRDLLEVDVAGEYTPIQVLEGAPAADLVVLNDADLSYVKVRLDPHSLETASQYLGTIEDPLTRAVVWTSLWDTWRDGEMSSDAYVPMILRGLSEETNSTAVRNQLAQAHAAVTAYSRPDKRDSLRASLTGGIAELLKQAEPGSDKQLGLANALISAITSPAGAELLAGWLVGEEVPEGLPVDQDRRWAIVTTLARIGTMSHADIDAELERDQTISGHEFAAGARAAMRDGGAKETAWQEACSNPTIPNGTHRAIAGNFWKYTQEALLADYVDRYMLVVEDIADSRGVWAERGHIARQTVLLSLWPMVLADEAFVQRVKDWLASREVPEQVRRVLANNIDNTERALKVAALA